MKQRKKIVITSFTLLFFPMRARLYAFRAGSEFIAEVRLCVLWYDFNIVSIAPECCLYPGKFFIIDGIKLFRIFFVCEDQFLLGSGFWADSFPPSIKILISACKKNNIK